MEDRISAILTEKLIPFGLTRQEATIYLCLLGNKDLSGYEVSKLTGISRSNVYGTLAGLVEKGAAYLLEGETNRYTAVQLEDFCQNKIRYLTVLKQELTAGLPRAGSGSEGYITVSGCRHIIDKIHNMLEHVEHRVYLSMPMLYLDQFAPRLEELAADGKKVVLLLSGQPGQEIKGSILYVTGRETKQLRLIVDSSYVLTGYMTGDAADSCLYCAQKEFVDVFKDALRNEIQTIDLKKGDGQG